MPIIILLCLHSLSFVGIIIIIILCNEIFTKLMCLKYIFRFNSVYLLSLIIIMMF